MYDMKLKIFHVVSRGILSCPFFNIEIEFGRTETVGQNSDEFCKTQFVQNLIFNEKMPTKRKA